ncbi:glycosyltransferase family 2 protein [Candidatus Poribacteria bacterium]
MQKPRFSIIMPAYNDGEFIGEAIESVLNQTYQSFELIVVDDGSTDNTPEVLSEFAEHPRVKTIRQKNGGTAAARNTGLCLASGEYIGFLDSDDFYTPDRLAVIDNYLTENRNVQCAATDHTIWNGERFSEPGAADGADELIKYGLNLMTPVHFCALIIRADIFQALGFFDPGFYYIEDVEMWYRLHAHGYAVHFINDCSYCYRRYGNINKTASGNSKGIHRDCIKIDVKYTFTRVVPLKMRLQCLRWLMGNMRKYVLNV